MQVALEDSPVTPHHSPAGEIEANLAHPRRTTP